MTSSILISAIALTASPAFAQRGADDHGDGSSEVEVALQRDLGLSPERAKEIGPLQDRAIALDAKLQDALGEGYAGSQFDMESGKLLVMVSDEGAAKEAEAYGADARLVKRSMRELSAIKADLDAAAGGATDPRERKAGKPQSNGLTSWTIDPVSNSVKVAVTDRQAKAADDLLAKYGDAITIEQTEDAPEAAAKFMDGGDAINFNSCSAGFNLRNWSTGQRYLLTAGHCVSAGSTLRGQDNTAFGPVLESWFPIFDDAIARNTNPGYWIQGPWVDTNPSNGGFITTTGFTDAPIGTIICKSGIKTKWTCGRITDKNESVTYTGGFTVHGLTEHNACVEPGDSGGANVSWTGRFRAEGVTSGARLRLKDGKKRCLSVFGDTNVSWYFPIADSLAWYGPRYGVTTW